MVSTAFATTKFFEVIMLKSGRSVDLGTVGFSRAEHTVGFSSSGCVRLTSANKGTLAVLAPDRMKLSGSFRAEPGAPPIVLKL
mmetsp:Transcript_37244/g.112620  ORF Transcript_37244/g.112620 Transcript_37244/m.112620 type:complete len:83 (+) Transcript_37244:245-493(+)